MFVYIYETDLILRRRTGVVIIVTTQCVGFDVTAWLGF